MVTQEKKKAIIKLLIRAAITVTLLWIVLSRIDLQQVRQALKNAKLQYLVIVWLLSIAALLAMSFKLQFILKKQQCAVKIKTLFRVSAITAFYSMFMPGMLSTGVKWYILKNYTGKGSNVLSSMIYNQVTDIYFRILPGFIVIAVAFPTQYNKLPVICGVCAAIFILIYVLLLNSTTGTIVNAAIRYILKPFPKIIRRPAQTVLEQLKVFQTAKWSFHLMTAAVSLFITMLSVVLYIYAARAARITVPVSGLVWQSSAIYILGRLPISLANCGIRELTLMGCMKIYKVGESQAVLMSGIIFTGAIVRAIIGALYLLFKGTTTDNNVQKVANGQNDFPGAVEV